MGVVSGWYLGFLCFVRLLCLVSSFASTPFDLCSFVSVCFTYI